MRRRYPLVTTVAVAVAVALGMGLVPGCGKTDKTLKITGLEPTKGDVQGGTYVRIFGNRFIADGARIAKVYFGGVEGTVDRFVSDGEMIVQAPGGNPNETVDLLVEFEPGGELKIPKAFTFVQKNDQGMSVDELKGVK